MGEPITITVKPFKMGTEKESALKPLEEAAEVYGAWQNMTRYMKNHPDMNYGLAAIRLSYVRIAFANEIADCITACCNLANRYNIDLQAAIARVEESNEKRGRYE